MQNFATTDDPPESRAQQRRRKRAQAATMLGVGPMITPPPTARHESGPDSETPSIAVEEIGEGPVLVGRRISDLHVSEPSRLPDTAPVRARSRRARPANVVAPRRVDRRPLEEEAAPSSALALRPTDPQRAIAPLDHSIERAPRDRPRVVPRFQRYSLGRIVVEHIDEGLVDPRLVVLTDPKSTTAESYRALFYRIASSTGGGSIMRTTCDEGRDASLCAANLALAMATSGGEPVLLVETRFGAPHLADIFGYNPSECFARRLAKHRREPDAPWRIAQLGQTNLNLLCLAPHREIPPALDAEALEDAVNGFARQGYRHVVFDAPPLTDDSDARFLARHVDGAIIAVHAGAGRKRAIKKGKRTLNGAPLLGYVLLEDDAS